MVRSHGKLHDHSRQRDAAVDPARAKTVWARGQAAGAEARLLSHMALGSNDRPEFFSGAGGFGAESDDVC